MTGEPSEHHTHSLQHLDITYYSLVAVKDSDIEAAQHTSEEQKEHMLTEKKKVEDFYCAQSYQLLGTENDQVQVPIWIDPSLDDDWKYWIEHGIKEINTAAPGLHLFKSDKQQSKVHILRGENPERAFTRGNIISSKGTVEIHLGANWSAKERTSTHELLHSLGFKHEQQRSDADKSIAISKKASNQVRSNQHIIGISRFDPFSIMLYCECDDHFSRRSDRDEVWKLKQDKSMNMQMSELDKVGLNLLYRPCKGPNYNPVVSSSTGIIYCGRPVMKRHNHPAGSITAKCGPNNSANCPACRTIKTSKVEEIWQKKKWQGWSGIVYCGRYFGVQSPGHDGYCGPNNGPPCPECKKILKF